MANKKTNTLTLLLLPLFAVVSLLLSSGVQAEDYVLEQQISDPNAATDVCTNIPGIQATVPEGMLVDSGSNCYTPTPTPVVTDLCSNIDGTQETLPNGYYRTTAGNCYIQPTPPVEPIDVCSNIEGTQLAIPEGYSLSTENTCELVAQPIDACPNIPGPQAILPEGMSFDNNICYTPASPSQNPPSTVTTTQTEPLKNIPGPIQPTARFFVNLVPEDVQQWLKSLPDGVAKTVPYYIFVVVAVTAFVPILQSFREAFFVRQLSALLKRERSIAEQKDNFVALASHYLRTPLTLMKSGLDTMIALGEVTSEATQTLGLHIAKLDEAVVSILHDVETDVDLKNISQPAITTSVVSTWRSLWFWGPIMSSAVLVLLANFFLSVVGDKEIGMTNAFVQFIIAAIAFTLLYLGVRNMHLQKKLSVESQSLIDREKTIDEARNVFITNTTSALQASLEPIRQSKVAIQDAPSARFFDEGFGRIESILEKFLLLSQVQTGIDRTLEVFDLHEAVDNLLVTYSSAISAKRITVANMTSPVFISQNPLMFNFVLGSLLDNAIKFNQEGGSIEINAEPDSKMLSIKVSDNGIGIETDKLEQLFKPFSRATSAIEFNYEGLGFSLFLDKIIMDYTGGEIVAQSSPNEGTQLVVTTPILAA